MEPVYPIFVVWTEGWGVEALFQGIAAAMTLKRELEQYAPYRQPGGEPQISMLQTTLSKLRESPANV